MYRNSTTDYNFGIAIPIIDAQLGYECLTSVPLHAPEALALVNSILPFVEWQSGKHLTLFNPDDHPL